MTGHSIPAPHHGLEIADEAFDILRSHSRQLVGLAAVVVVPAELLIAYMNRSSFAGHTFSNLNRNSSTALNRSYGSFGLYTAALSLAAIVSVVGLALVAGPVARMVSAWVTGRSISTRDALRLPAKSWLTLVVTCLVVHLMEMVGGLVFVVGSLFPLVVFAIASPVVAIEGAGPFRSLGRTWSLTMRRFGPVLGIVAAMSVVTSLFTEAVGALPTVLPQLVGFTGGWVLAGVGQVIAKLVGFSVTSVFVALLYIDLRVWTEGMDIVMEVVPAGDRPGPAPSTGGIAPAGGMAR